MREDGNAYYKSVSKRRKEKTKKEE